MTNSTLAVSTAQEKKNKVLDVALCAGCKNRITKNPPFFCSDCQWRAMIDRMERDAESHVGSLPVEVQIDMEEELEPGEYSLGSQTDDSLIVPEYEEGPDTLDELDR